MIEVLKQALEAWQTSVYGSDKHHKAMLLAMTKMNQAIAEFDSHTLYREGYVNGYAFGEAAGRKAVAEKQDGACQHCAGKGCVACDAREQEPDKYEMDIECTKCGAKQSGVLTVNTHPPQRTEPKVCCQQYDTCLEPCTPRGEHLAQRTWVGLTGEMLLKAAQSSLAPEQYDHFEAMSKHQPDIYDRLAYAIRVQDE